MRKAAFFLSSFFLILFQQNILAQNQSESDQTLLDEILKKTSQYCEKLDGAIFDFVCLEEISEIADYSLEIERNLELSERYKIPRIEKKEYLYDYQLIRKGGETKERRILLEENGREKYEENAELKTSMFHFKNVIFGPLGLLSETWQSNHLYKIIKKETLNGEKAIVIEAVPKNTVEQYHLFGKIWIRESDYSILKIEWDQNPLRSFPIIEETAKKYKAKPKITMISEYGYEKKGIRFPSKFYIEEAYIRKGGEKFIYTKTTVIYKDYKFFTVETEVQH